MSLAEQVYQLHGAVTSWRWFWYTLKYCWAKPTIYCR